MDKAFLASRVSSKPRILGLKLLPLSLGHRLILERAGSPFVTGQSPGVIDVIFAVLVCSMTFEQASEYLDKPEFGNKIKKWVKGLRKVNFLDKLQEFQRYWYYGNLVPEYTTTEEDESSGNWSGTPWPQRLKIVLMSELHMPESEVMNRSLRLCWWDYLCYEEIKGRVTVLSEEIVSIEESMLKQANEVAEALRNNGHAN